MLILDVGKIKYNKKFYKAIIYTTLVMDILSFGIFPKSQSKYKEDKLEKYSYSAKLYADKKIEEVTTDVDIVVNNIKLVEDDYRYISDSQNAFFEYQIINANHQLDFDRINENISFHYTTNKDAIKGDCSVVEYQESMDEKGIVWCPFSDTSSENANYFESTGINVSMTAEDSYVKTSTDKIETFNLHITGSKEYSSTSYRNTIKKLKDEKVLVLYNQNNCTAFHTWLEEYYAYYIENASEYYTVTDEIKTKDLDTIKKYIAKYVDSTSCNLNNLNIPGIHFETITDSNSSLKRFVYTIEDNFLGYAKTFTQDASAKNMYFTTSDGQSFQEETDNAKWQSILKEYLNVIYSKENPLEIAQYIEENTNGILSILQNVDETNAISGITHTYQDGKVVIEPSLLDLIYNTNHRENGKVRITILGKDTESKSKMYDAFKKYLDVVYKGVYDDITIKSLWYNNDSNLNLAQRTEIRNIIMNPVNDIYVEDLYDYKDEYFSIYYKFNVHLYSDGTYNWFEILPLGGKLELDAKETYYRLNWNLSSTQNKQEEYLRRIERLNKYYGINKQASINESITYRRDSSGNIIGYVQIEHLNGDINDIRYKVYTGNDFDQNVIKETTTISASETETESLPKEELDFLEKDTMATEKVDDMLSVDKNENTDSVESVSAPSNLQTEDYKEKKEDTDLVKDHDTIEDTLDTIETNESSLDDSDKTKDITTLSSDNDTQDLDSNTATNLGADVQDIGSDTTPSPSTDNSVETDSISEIEISINTP